MVRVLHLLAGADTSLAPTVIGQDLEAGDEVTVVLLADATTIPPLPDRVRLRRVPSDWSYDQLLEQIFNADRVITW